MCALACLSLIGPVDLVPLPKIMELKEKYCFRIILDDSYGIGVLGKTGRGTCEHYGIKVRTLASHSPILTAPRRPT